MVIPCIDLMGGRVVQLVQGREKALEAEAPLVMLERFAGFPVIQVIDLDAAMGQGSNDETVRLLASRAVTRVGGGVRSTGRARALVDAGASRVIVGTAAFDEDGIRHEFLEQLAAAVGRERILLALDSKGGRIVVKGWRQATRLEAEAVIRELEPFCDGFLCTYVDKEGMLQGTDLDWYRRLRECTAHELTAAGGITTLEEIDELTRLGIHAALGMAVYTGRLKLDDLRRYAAQQ
jgi:phosphoribosylformimino-5-aminoimidazole carboxamide ribotide isomerase